VTFEVIASGYGLVEAPTVAPDGSLLFSDVVGGGVYRVGGEGMVSTVVPKRRGIGGMAIHAGGGLVASGRSLVHVREGESRTVLEVGGVAGWNDLCTDAYGRVYAGALRFGIFDPGATPVPGELWQVTADGNASILYGDVVHPNGVALSPDERTIYHSDTRTKVIVVHDLGADGTVSGRRLIDVSAHGEPDGLAVDELGAVWVAILGGFGLARFTPTGELDRRLEVPSKLVTSLCFGGSDRRDLFVTTGHHEDETLRGCVLRTRVTIAGAPVHPARV
jgi:gluconolactonase